MKRRYVLVAGLVLLTAATVGGIWFASHGRYLLFGRQPSAEHLRLLAALDEPTRVAVVEAPLRDVLAELAKRHGTTIRLDEDALKTAGVTGKLPVTLDVDGVRLRSALNLLCRRISTVGLEVVVQEQEIVVTTWDVAETPAPLIGRVYPVTPLMFGDGPVDEQSLAMLITDTIWPESWASSVGGPGEIEVLPGGIAVAHTLEVHLRIEQLLEALERLSDDDTRTAPIDASAWPSARHTAIARALEDETTLEAVDLPLALVCDHLADRHGIPIFVDYVSLADNGVSGDTPITAQLSGCQLRRALKRVLREHDLTYVVGNDVLMITSAERAETMRHIRIYPIRDLVGVAMTDGYDYKPLMEAIIWMIDPDTWLDNGGSCTILEFAGCLIIEQTYENHLQIETLLTDIRGRLDPYATLPPEPPDSPAVRRIEAALAETTELFLETRIFDVRRLTDPDFGVVSAFSLIDMLESCPSAASWLNLGGSGTAIHFRGLLVVSQTRDCLGHIQALLDGLTQLQNSPDSLAPITVAPPGTVGNGEVEEKLKKPAEFSFHGVPLEEVCRQLTREYGIPVLTKRNELRSLSQYDYPVFRTVRNMSLGAALDWALHGIRLDYVTGGGAVWITLPETARQDVSFRIYPVHDLVHYPGRPPQPPDGPRRLVPYWKDAARVDYDPLMETIQECVEPESWYGEGGSGEVHWCEGALVVSQTSKVHAEIERLLAAMRHHLNLSDEPLPDPPAIEQALASPADIESTCTPFRLLLDEIGRRYNVTIILDAPTLVPFRLPRFPPIRLPPDPTDPFGGGAVAPFGGGARLVAYGDDPFGGGGNLFDRLFAALIKRGRRATRDGVESTRWESKPLRRVALRYSRWGLDMADEALRCVRENKTRLRFELAVGARPIKCDISDVSLEETLRKIVQPLGLELAVRDEAIWITTPKNEQTVLTTEVYDVRELTRTQPRPPSNDPAEMFSYPDINFYPFAAKPPRPWYLGVSPYPWHDRDHDDLTGLLLEFVNPESWKFRPGRASAELYNGLLIVRQTRGGHAEVRRFLSFLRSEAEQLPTPWDLTGDPDRQQLQTLLDYLARADDPRELAFAVYLIGRARPSADVVVPALMELLAGLDRSKDTVEYDRVVDALVSYERDAAEALPLLVKQWRAMPEEYRWSDLIQKIACLGPAAVPFLCETLKNDKRLEGAILYALQCLGPDAEEAVVPLLESLTDDETHNGTIVNVIIAIDPDGSLSRKAVDQWVNEFGEDLPEHAARAKAWVRTSYGDPY